VLASLRNWPKGLFASMLLESVMHEDLLFPLAVAVCLRKSHLCLSVTGQHLLFTHIILRISDLLDHVLLLPDR
jgi:hypothetical protein